MPAMRESLALSLVVLVGYAGAALGVTNAFPLSTFPMYSDSAFTTGARLVVRDQDGEYTEVVRWTAWTCEPELEYELVELTMCPDGEIAQPAGYLSKDALDHIRAHTPTAASSDVVEPVALVIRAWRLDRPEMLALDCLVATCTAARR
jgi:hypothetical protein